MSLVTFFSINEFANLLLYAVRSDRIQNIKLQLLFLLNYNILYSIGQSYFIK